MGEITKKIGEIAGGLTGFVTGTVTGGVKAVITLAETGGDFEQAGETLSETLGSHIETASEIGGKCEGLIEVGLSAVVGAMTRHYVDKALKDNEEKQKKA